MNKSKQKLRHVALPFISLATMVNTSIGIKKMRNPNVHTTFFASRETF